MLFRSGLRGYPNNSLTPIENNAYAGHVYDKFTMELRYPLVMQPQSTIYGMLFFEGGNAWSDINKFNPFDIKRSLEPFLLLRRSLKIQRILEIG